MERRWREEDLDEYEEDDGDGFGYEEEEEEEEEEEVEEERKPTQEELEYLSRREKIKERIRQKHRRESGLASRAGTSVDRRNPAVNTGFGSFFGPSQPVIARRVIEERHSMRETEHIRAKDPISNPAVRRVPSSTNGEGRAHSHQQRPKVVNQFKAKAQTLKDIRDYSFLFSDDADLPTTSKEPPSRNQSIPISDSRPTQAPPRTNATMNKHPVRVSGGSEMKRTASASQNAQAKMGLSKASSLDRSRPSSSAPRNLPNGSAGRGLAQPPLQKAKSASTSAHQNAGAKKPSTTAVNKSVNLDRKASVTKPSLSSQKHYSEQRREPQALSKAKPMGKQSMPSSRPQQPISSKPQQMVSSSKPKQPMPLLKPQLSKPSKQIPQQRSKQIPQQRAQERPLKRRPSSYSDEDDNDGAASVSSMIRQMFRYNPNKYRNIDEDDSDMEANFDDIMREEKRSEKIARQEDEEQLRLIEEEERRERMRKLAKKRKIG